MLETKNKELLKKTNKYFVKIKKLETEFVTANESRKEDIIVEVENKFRSLISDVTAFYIKSINSLDTIEAALDMEKSLKRFCLDVIDPTLDYLKRFKADKFLDNIPDDLFESLQNIIRQFKNKKTKKEIEDMFEVYGIDTSKLKEKSICTLKRSPFKKSFYKNIGPKEIGTILGTICVLISKY